MGRTHTDTLDQIRRGQLPFVGRAAEIDRIVRFWEQTLAAESLRALLIVGEAGIGKSTLLERAASCIMERGGLVVHTKLYPDSTSALLPNLATTLSSSAEQRRLLRDETQPTVSGVAEALRRLSQLRPTTIVIEDIHLLTSDAARDMSLTLDALADETLSIICAARPVDMTAGSALQRFIVDQFVLEGLTTTDLTQLWKTVSSGESAEEAAAALERATLGNPLIVRAAICRAVVSASVELDLADAMRQSIHESVDILAEGMIVGLRRDEIEAACRLAVLGETFAPAAAEALLDDAASMLDRLREGGVISRRAVHTAPLPEPRDAGDDRALADRRAGAFAFTHSITHRYLFERASLPMADLLRALNAAGYLYSTLPFTYITRNVAGLEVADEVAAVAEAVIERSLAIARAMHRTPDWQAAPLLVDAAESLLASIAGGLTPLRMRDLEASVLVARIVVLARDDHSEEFRSMVERLMALTESEESDVIRRCRLVALRALATVEVRREDGDYAAIWEQARSFVERHSELRTSTEHLSLLQWLLGYSVMMEDHVLVRAIESHVRGITSDETIDADVRRSLERQFAPYYLLIFDSEEELARREEDYERLSGDAAVEDLTRTMRITYLYLTGRPAEAIQHCRNDLPRHVERGLDRNAYSCQLTELACEAMLGGDLHRILDRAERVCTAYPALEEEFRASVPWYLIDAFLLCDERDSVQMLIDRFNPPEYVFDEETQEIIAMLRGDDALRSPAPEALIAAMSIPALGVNQVLTIRWALATNERDGGDGVDIKARRAAIERVLEWMAHRGLHALMVPWIERHRSALSDRDATTWQSRARTIERERLARNAADRGGAGLRLHLLGEVSVQNDDAERVKLRGGRIVTLLGLMVANEMIESRLSHQEFRTLAAGGDIERDPERARKTMNMAVLRLREAIGYDAVLTDSETPRLNLDMVTVDLLDVAKLIASARDALRDRSLVRAHGPLMQALEIHGGSVPFPGLYDDFFEALREDFENDLRTAVVDVAKSLMRAGDNDRAEQILARAYGLQPDDAGIAELLESVLVALNRRTDATRIRLRAALADAA